MEHSYNCLLSFVHFFLPVRSDFIFFSCYYYSQDYLVIFCPHWNPGILILPCNWLDVFIFLLIFLNFVEVAVFCFLFLESFFLVVLRFIRWDKNNAHHRTNFSPLLRQDPSIICIYCSRNLGIFQFRRREQTLLPGLCQEAWVAV